MQGSKIIPQYNIFQAIFMSFYSKNLYRDVALNWGGKSFLYLLMLLTLVSIYFAIAMQHFVSLGYQSLYTSLAPQIPVLTIKNGKISTPENHPYFITDPNTKDNYAVIDTTGQYTTIEQAKSLVLITQTQVITQPKTNETKIYTVPADFQQSVDPKKINGFMQKILGYLWIPFFILSLIVFYTYRVLQALVYSIIGKIFAIIFRVQLSYVQILQIMMVAITPAIIISTIQHTLTIGIQHELSLYFLLGIMYLFYGIIANKN